jgi:hypothetical protein
MTAIQKRHGPFAEKCPSYWGAEYTVTCDAGDRIRMVRESCDAEWLEAVIKHKDTQKTVRAAAERRLRWVNTALTSRKPGETYVMMREGDPWHACHVTWLAHTQPFQIGRRLCVDCFLPKRWRKIAKAKKNEIRPVALEELW